MGDALISRASKNNNVNIVQETGNSETDAMSQKAVTDAIPTKISELENDSKYIANNAAGGLSTSLGERSDASGASGVSVGYLSQASGDFSTALGYYSEAGTDKSQSQCTAIGYFSKVTADGGTALGKGTKVTSAQSVAIGCYSEANETRVVSFGDSVWGGRRLINVKDPIDNQDAATKNYVDLQIANVPSGGNINVTQEIGISTTNVMSQNACTNSFAVKNHEHSAEDIISGVVSIENGGTGATTSDNARINLEVPTTKTITNQLIDFNDYTEVGFYSLYNPLYNVPDTSMSGNYSYSLIVSHGVFKNGTYDIDQLAVSQNGDMYLRHYSRSFKIWYSWQRLNNTSAKPLEIIKGGTGASSSEKARTNLGVYSKIEVDSKLDSTNGAINIYVESSGDDETGDGSQEKPYASIAKATSVIPKNVNHSVAIHIGQGTFEMPINAITGFNGSGEIAIIGQDTLTENKTIISNKLRFGHNTIRKIWLGNMTFQYSNTTTAFDDIVDVTGIIEFNTLTFNGTENDILQAPLKIYNVPNAVIESCKFDHADNAIALIGTTRGYVNNCTVNNCNYAVAVFSGAMGVLRSPILGNTNTVYKQADSGSSILYPNGTFSES